MGVKWNGMNVMVDKVDALNGRVPRAILAGCQFSAPQIESWMKTNATWTDRTGNARNGLKARASGSTKGAQIALSHSVPYGIWLEVRWGGRYGIIAPAIEQWAPRVLENVGRFISKEMGR